LRSLELQTLNFKLAKSEGMSAARVFTFFVGFLDGFPALERHALTFAGPFLPGAAQ